MKKQSIVLPALVAAVGVIALVAALVVSFIPFSKAGASAPTAAFRAQADLDAVLFKLATSPAAKFTGKLDYKASWTGVSGTVEFTDLTATSSNNVQGTISVGGQQGEYRQIGNRYFVSAPQAFWPPLLTSEQKNKLDLAPLDRKWAEATYASLPNLGVQLSSNNLAGIVGNTEQSSPPKLGAPIRKTDVELPDDRFWPESDPAVTFEGDNLVRVGEWTVTYDPQSKTITHLKGTYQRFNDSFTLDTSVTPLTTEQTNALFGAQRAIANDLTTVPAPGVRPSQSNAITVQANGSSCALEGSGQRCSWTVTASGDTNFRLYTPGHFNFGVTATFLRDGRPDGGTCQVVIRADVNGKGSATCSTSVISLGGRVVRIVPDYRYLGFTDSNADQINELIDNTQKRTTTAAHYVRTGSKRPDAAKFDTSINALPSFYAVEYGNYQFDGIATDGGLVMTFGPGYAEHIHNGVLDADWAGTNAIAEQLDKQLAAVGDQTLYYYTAEETMSTALIALAKARGHDGKVKVYYSPTT